MCDNCCVGCHMRDYEACKKCNKENKFSIVITAEDLTKIHNAKTIRRL